MNHLLNQSALQSLDGEVGQRLPNRRGFLLVDANGKEPDLRIHLRPFLRGGNGSLAGFRIERLAQSWTKPDPSGRYMTIVVSTSSVETDEQLDEQLSVYVDDLQSRDLPWILVESETGAKEVYLVNQEDGTRTVIEQDTPTILQQRLPVTIEGTSRKQDNLLLPTEITVDADARSAILSIYLKDDSHFAATGYHLKITNLANAPLGKGKVLVDVNCKFGNKDKLDLKAAAFEDEVSVEYLAQRPELAPESKFHDGKLILHLVYDRTAIDADRLPGTLDSLERSERPSWQDPAQNQGIRIGEPSPENPSSGSQESLNANLRKALAEALSATAAELHGDVSFYLWWFADCTREGIASNDKFPFEEESYRRVGACQFNTISTQLCSRIFNYATGYDIADAVDEALVAVAQHVKDESKFQHAVLIVGDSPPPPYGPEDPLWTALTGGEKRARSNSRRSELFRRALADLHRLETPVAWLYLRSDPTAHLSAGENIQSQLNRLHGLKEDILIALTKQEFLIVEGCEQLANFPESLSSLFGKMARRDLDLAEFKVLRVNSNRQ